MTDTFIVIVSYNDAARTLACVRSLEGQGRIIVWDNASTDGTLEALQDQDCLIHSSTINSLWTPALNSAMDLYYHGEDYIVWSNNDITYRPGTIARLQTAFANPNCGLAAPSGSRLGGLQDFAVNHPMPKAPDGHPIMSQADWVESRPTVRTTYVVGASTMIHRDIYQLVGPLDNEMPLGADDHDYSLRIKQAGFSIWVVNSAYVDHAGHASASKNPSGWTEWGEKSWAAFDKKWDGYFHDEEEAIKCHWGGTYHPGWDYGTGRLTSEERAGAYAKR